jgi:hypothetical protein
LGKENEADGVTWDRGQYIHFVSEKLTDPPTNKSFLDSFRTARAAPARPARQGPTNDCSRGPPKTREDERVDQIRSNIAERFKASMRKAAQKEAKKSSKTSIISDTSESESVHMAQPVEPIRAKAMLVKESWRKKSDIPESSATASGSSASASRPAENTATERQRQPVKASANKREASVCAKELFKDAEAAKEVYSKFKQEFIEIQSSALKAHNVVKKR